MEQHFGASWNAKANEGKWVKMIPLNAARSEVDILEMNACILYPGHEV